MSRREKRDARRFSDLIAREVAHTYVIAQSHQLVCVFDRCFDSEHVPGSFLLKAMFHFPLTSRIKARIPREYRNTGGTLSILRKSDIVGLERAGRFMARQAETESEMNF